MLISLGYFTKAQVTLSEDFNSPFAPNSGTGWSVQNNSVPTGTLNWFQGNNNVFSAFNGGASDYFAANYNSASNNGDISNWLISPTVTLVNGATIQFATRTVSATTVYPDRLEVRLSPNTSGTIGLGASTVSSFSIVAFSVNPNLSTSSSSANPTNSSVATYPQNWTVYTAVVSGITGTVNGRIGFRYFVTNGGPNGANSSYIGLDAVKYTLPCSQPSLSIVSSSTAGICSGSTVNLNVSNTGTVVSANTFSWSNGSTGTTNVVSPTVTTTYSAFGTSSAGCVGTATVAVTVSTTPNLQFPSHTVCPGNSFTLSATGASSYAFNGGSTSTLSSIVISPTATTVYTVTGLGTNSACPATIISTISVGPQLSVLINSNSTSICPGNSITLSAISAASIYSWSTGSSSSSISVSPSVSTVYTVGVLSSTTCFGANTIAIVVNPTPTLSMIITPSANICSNSTFTVNTSGANSYNYVLGPNFISSSNPIAIIAPITSVTANSQFTITGTNTLGCSSSMVYSFIVNPNPVFAVSPALPVVCINQSITLTASSSASNISYVWSGAGSGTSSNINYNASATPTNVNYNVVATNAVGCRSTQNINLSVSSCSGLESINGNPIAVYPNPFKDELNFKNMNGSVEIYNLIGESVLSQQINAGEVVSTSKLAQGIYLLKFIDAQSNIVQALRIIKE